MKKRTSRGFARVLVLAALAAGCGRSEGERGAAAAEPAAFDGEECALCGMTVREQPAPRAQVIHRDGTRLFFCAIGDLLTHLGAPSPHGAVDVIFVETLDDASDATNMSTAPRPWSRAEDAAFVVGIQRQVMGEPVLVYSSRAAADASARRQGGSVLGWTELRARTGDMHGGHTH